MRTKLLSAMLALTITFGSIMPFIQRVEPVSVYADEPDADDELTVMVYARDEIPTTTLNYNGKNIGKTSFVELDGVEYPAFCVDPKLHAAEAHPNRQCRWGKSGFRRSALPAADQVFK